MKELWCVGKVVRNFPLNPAKHWQGNWSLCSVWDSKENAKTEMKDEHYFIGKKELNQTSKDDNAPWEEMEWFKGE